MTNQRLSERHKRPGVYYAFTDSGLELPLIDVTHPAFRLDLDPQEIAQRVDAFMREQAQLGKLPALARELLLRVMLRGSVLARGLRAARGKYLAGIDTYLFKLGPDNLGSAYARPIDRKVAAALPALAMRLRLQDHAQLLAQAVRAPLEASAGSPLRLLNIAGGAAFDSLNALLLLQRASPRLLQGRAITICVLDCDSAGPSFGQRALHALQHVGAPLHGLDVRLVHQPYDFRHAEGLRAPLAEAAAVEAVCAVSSEGGLFEYGSDGAIVDNLRALRAAPRLCGMVGSVTRCDAPMQALQASSISTRAPLHLRGLARFSELAQSAGFGVARAIERPFADDVLLAPTG